MSKIHKKMRELIVKAAYTAKHGHIPSALSIVEIMQSYHDVETQDDVMILSKGHGCLALYSLLVIQGHVDEKELLTFGKKGSKLGGHPDRNKLKEIYASTGSLGHGLPIAVGTALSRKIQKKDGRIFCLIGDGESNEGTIWESIMVASKNKLNNLVCILDNNNSQVRSLPINDLSNRFMSFGCNVWNVDGHDIKVLSRAMDNCDEKKRPTVVIANTKKGNGISDMEDDIFAWHHRAPNDDEYKKFMEELNEN